MAKKEAVMKNNVVKKKSAGKSKKKFAGKRGASSGSSKKVSARTASAKKLKKRKIVKKTSEKKVRRKSLKKKTSRKELSVRKMPKTLNAGKPLSEDYLPEGAPTSDERAKSLTAMRIYLNQIENIPLLSPEEEYELAKIIYEKKRGSKRAREKMIRSNLRLVINIAKRYMNLGLPFSDLVEEGNIGLMRAVDKFNYKKGYRFSTYASWWIKQAMMRALSNQGKLIRIPVHMFEVINKMRKVKEYLMHTTGKMPTEKEIAKIMKIKVKKVKEVERVAATSSSSLNAPISIDGNAELMDLIEDVNLKLPHDKILERQKYSHIEKFLRFLNPREKTILIMRFGLYDSEPYTLEVVAKKFGITRERVRQIEEGALKKIRKQLLENNESLDHYI